MSCQIIRVISSPSISTTGFATLIFAISDKTFCKSRGQRGVVAGARAYRTRREAAKDDIWQFFPGPGGPAIQPARRVSLAGRRHRQDQALDRTAGADRRPG